MQREDILSYVNKLKPFREDGTYKSEGITLLTEKQVSQVCKLVSELFLEESNIINIDSPANVCGDLHGQFYDLFQLEHKQIKDEDQTQYEFYDHQVQQPQTKNEDKSKNYEKYSASKNLHDPKLIDNQYQQKWVFIGDFVDRGYQSIETITYLFCMKILHPDKYFLTRGNHESRAVTMTYGFYDEFIRKYGNQNLWYQFMEVFDLLPLGVVIDNKVLAIHGGLSPNIKSIDHMRQIHRFQEIPIDGPLADLMWSDPEENQKPDFTLNNRGAGYMFSENATKGFLQRNGLDLMVRAHQLAEKGYQIHHGGKLVTIWSAPNYCYRCKNKAAFLILDKNNLEISTQNTKLGFVVYKENSISKDTESYKTGLAYFL